MGHPISWDWFPRKKVSEPRWELAVNSSTTQLFPKIREHQDAVGRRLSQALRLTLSRVEVVFSELARFDPFFYLQPAGLYRDPLVPAQRITNSFHMVQITDAKGIWWREDLDLRSPGLQAYETQQSKSLIRCCLGAREPLFLCLSCTECPENCRKNRSSNCSVND